MWKRTNDKGHYNIDVSFEKLHEFDGGKSKEKIRFVQYGGQNKENVMCHHTKIDEENGIWEMDFNTVKEIKIKDVEFYFGVSIESNGIKRVINAVKDIFNDTRK